jgi:hypothetical protein
MCHVHQAFAIITTCVSDGREEFFTRTLFSVPIVSSETTCTPQTKLTTIIGVVVIYQRNLFKIGLYWEFEFINYNTASALGVQEMFNMVVLASGG